MKGEIFNKPSRLLGVIFGGLAVVLLITGIWFMLTPGSADQDRSARKNAGQQGARPLLVLSTCPVCGYKTLPPDSLYCPVCYVELSEEERITWEYSSIEEMIYEEQSMFFAAEGYQDSVSFFRPPSWTAGGITYEKDTAWRPVVAEEEVQMLRDTLLRAGVIIQ